MNSPINPEVSVIIPTKNRRNLLEQTVKSLQDQTFSQWEAVIVDDGSEDTTWEYLTHVMELDPRVHPVRRAGERSNANVCRNQGVAVSKGTYIVFLDSDDLLAPHSLEKRVHFMRRNPDIDAAVYPGRYFHTVPGDTNRSIGEGDGSGEIDRLLGMHWPMPTMGPIWRRSALGRIGAWDESLPSWQDVDFHFRALTSGITMIRCVGHDFYVRESNTYTRTSTMQQKSEEHFNRAEYLFAKIHKRLVELDMMTRTRGYLLAGNYLNLSEKRLMTGLVRDAFRTWLGAYRTRLIGKSVFLVGTLYLALLSVGPRRVWARVYCGWKWRWRLTRGPELF